MRAHRMNRERGTVRTRESAGESNDKRTLSGRANRARKAVSRVARCHRDTLAADEPGPRDHRRRGADQADPWSGGGRGASHEHKRNTRPGEGSHGTMTLHHGLPGRQAPSSA